MQWKTILNKWKSGFVLSYPKSCKNRFIWRTSVLNKGKKLDYKQEFINANSLSGVQNYLPFSEYIKKSKNKYATAFTNLSGDTILIIPMPRKDKNFASIKDFIDNASLKQQQKLWQMVSKCAIHALSKYKQIYISTHGYGVAYLHIRICYRPKYYGESKLLQK